ncbi:TIGR04282 family arsenosugar biosynthesis glycosyltransferase [Desulfoplanes sp.]
MKHAVHGACSTGPQTCCVLFFLRFPELGKVKTRLAAGVGEKPALELYRCFVLDTLAMLDTLDSSLILCFTPNDARKDMARWLGGQREYLVQQGDDLGERMDAAFTHAFSRGYSRVLLVGSDIPDMSSDTLKEGFAWLVDNDACLAPATDGGYYCIGFTRSGYCPEVFQNMTWSTPEVFEQTRERLTTCGASIHLLPPAGDVDTMEDLAAFWQRSGNFNASCTRSYLERTGLLEGEVGSVGV